MSVECFVGRGGANSAMSMSRGLECPQMGRWVCKMTADVNPEAKAEFPGRQAGNFYQKLTNG